MQNSLSSTGCTGRKMKRDKVLITFQKNLDNILYTGDRDRTSKRREFLMDELPRSVVKTEPGIADKTDNFQGEGMKIVNPSKIIYRRTTLEALLGLNVAGYTEILIEASNLIDELYRRGKIQNEEQPRNVLDSFYTNKIILPSMVFKQIVFNTRTKNEEYSTFSGKSTHGENLSQPLQTEEEQLKTAITFLSGCNGAFNVTSKTITFSFETSINDKNGLIQKTIPPGAYEVEYPNNEIKTIIIEERDFDEADYRFLCKSYFSTLGSIIEM